jgi:uncharacterized protein YndB with AHSA1/START domain
MTIDPNPPATIDPDAFSVSRTITIKAPIDRVWAAVTEPEHIVKWAGSGATLDRLDVGGRGTWTFDGYGTVPLEIEELDPPHAIAYRWGNAKYPDIDPGQSTVFRFTLTPVDGGTQLTVVETGFETLSDPAARMADNQGGWTSELDELVAYLEGAA